jgi:hypothetical protein
MGEQPRAGGLFLGCGEIESERISGRDMRPPHIWPLKVAQRDTGPQRGPVSNSAAPRLLHEQVAGDSRVTRSVRPCDPSSHTVLVPTPMDG